MDYYLIIVNKTVDSDVMKSCSIFVIHKNSIMKKILVLFILGLLAATTITSCATSGRTHKTGCPSVR